MKVLVIGNSHVGSLKRGWDNISLNYTNKVETVFAASRGRGMEEILINDGIMSGNTERLRNDLLFTAGESNIHLDQFDTILVYGLRLRSGVFYRWLSPSSKLFYSKQCLIQTFKDYHEEILGFKIACQIRSQTDVPIFIGAPLISTFEKPEIRKKLTFSPDLYIDAIDRANTLFWDPIGLCYFPQPQDTIETTRLRTKEKYSKESRQLAVGDGFDNKLHTGTDRGHMNEYFGERYLESFIDKCIDK